MNKKNLLSYGLLFLGVYLILSLFLRPGEEPAPSGADFDIKTLKDNYRQNNEIAVEIKNNTSETAIIENNCPNEPLRVERKVAGEWQQISATADISCENTSDTEILPGESTTIEFTGFNFDLFGEIGTYKIFADVEVPENSELSTTIESNEFDVKKQGWFNWLWTAGFYQPIYNALIWIVSVIPGHNLGFAIIILTLIIRGILVFPSQGAMKSQRRLQEIQPKLNKIKEKYKGDQERIAKETMALWKEHKVNPFGSCLPIFIQLPFLIAIFYVVQTGLSPDNIHLLYGPLKDFSITSINTVFLGILDLTEINILVLPIIVGGLQFLQMKLAMARTKKKQAEKEANGEKTKKQAPEMEMASNMMMYTMPVLIAIFTASIPSGVGLYWATSTVFGIFQQYFVNKAVQKESSSIKVIKGANKK